MERGPLGERFTANLDELRKRAGLDQKDIAERMTKLGHPLGINAVSRLMKGERRADVSELVALAIALGVTPNRLLLSGTASSDEESASGDNEIDLTSTVRVPESAAWQWAAGNAPLPDEDLPEEIASPDLLDFQEVNRPHAPPDRTTLAEITEYTPDLQEMLREAADMLVWQKGVPPRILSAYLRHFAFIVPLRYEDGEEEDRGEHQEAP